MRGWTSRSGRSAVVILLVMGLVAGFAGPAGGDSFPPLLHCDGNGTVVVVPGPPGPDANSWTISAKAVCQGDNTGTHFAEVSGSGFSATLGLCDGTEFVQHLVIKVTITLTSFSTGLTRVLTETWSAPVTTFPVVTPFFISAGGLASNNDLVGAGTIFTRIGGICPPLGNPAAKIYWARELTGA